MSKVVVANDHGAVEVNYLGTAENKSVDYPDMAKLACDEFLKGGYEFGILCCGTGIGISISANKIRGIRCALPQNVFAATMAKEHNDANFIAFGGRIDYQDDVLDMVKAYITTQVSQDERHARRRAKMMALEG